MNVLVSDIFPTEGLAVFKEAAGIDLDYRPGISAEELLQAVQSADALVVRSGTRITAELFDAAPKLRVVGRAGIGIENIDLEAANRKGVIVMNTPFGSATTAAEHSIAMLLALGSVVGVSVGVSLAVQIPTHVLKIAIGTIITFAGISIWILHTNVLVYRTWKMFALASVASFNKALSGGGYGPLMTSGQILSGIKGKSSVGITSFAEGFTCLVGVILFLGKGYGFTPDLLVPVLTGALLSVPFSTEFVKHINETTFKKMIAVLTVIMGLFTIFKVLL